MDLSNFVCKENLVKLCHTEDLLSVTQLTLKVDTDEHSLADLGTFLPNLTRLNLDGSRVSSLRDLGYNLTSIRVLSINNCSLTDLDGIEAFTTLREVYCRNNDIDDLTPLCGLSCLEVLDMRRTTIDDVEVLDFLAPLQHLKALSLAGAPVAESASYRDAAQRALPQLVELDGIPTSSAPVKNVRVPCPPPRPHRTRPQSASAAGQRARRVLRSRIDKGAVSAGNDASRPARPRPSTARPQGRARGPHRSSVAVWMGVSGHPDPTSSLTFGAGDALCGNFLTALRRRRRHSSASHSDTLKKSVRVGSVSKAANGSVAVTHRPMTSGCNVAATEPSETSSRSSSPPSAGPSEDCFVGMAPTRSPSMRSLSPNPSVCLAPCLSPAMDTVSQPSDASSPTSLPVSSACAFSSLAVEPVHAAPPRAYPRDHMLNSYHRTGRVGGRGTSTGSSISPCTPIRARGKVDQRRRASSARVRARRLRGAVDAVPVVGVPADVV